MQVEGSKWMVRPCCDCASVALHAADGMYVSCAGSWNWM